MELHREDGGSSVEMALVLPILVVLLFGRGKISELMGDVAKGIKSFKKGMKDDEEGDVAGRVTTDHIPSDRAVADGPAAEPIDVTPRKEREDA